MAAGDATVPRLWLQETYLNATKGHGIGESDPYEAWTGDLGELYRTLRKEYGRCTGRVYVDHAPNAFAASYEPRAVGWVFLSRQRYEDDRTGTPAGTYLREVWVTVYAKPPVTHCRTEVEYADFPAARTR